MWNNSRSAVDLPLDLMDFGEQGPSTIPEANTVDGFCVHSTKMDWCGCISVPTVSERSERAGRRATNGSEEAFDPHFASGASASEWSAAKGGMWVGADLNAPPLCSGAHSVPCDKS